MIHTDDSGRPFERPVRRDFPNDVSFVRAFHAYQDAIRKCANDAFDDEFRKAVRR